MFSLLALTVAGAGTAFSQAAAQTSKSPASEQEYSIFDIAPFGGWQWFQAYAGSAARTHKLQDKYIFGLRANEDFSNYVGLEESFTWGPANNLLLQPVGQNNYLPFKAHNYQAALTPMIYFDRREARVRPYVTAGIGYTWFEPGQMNNLVTTSVGTFTQHMHGSNYVAFVYGLGMKVNASPRVGFRVDLRGMYTKEAAFGLPSFPPGTGFLYVSDRGGESALQLSAGVLFRLGLRNVGTKPMMTLSCASNPAGTIGQPYMGAPPAVTNGTAPYMYSATGLPAGLSMDPMTGSITGTPTTSGTFTYTVRVTDSTKQVAETQCMITINGQITLSPISGARNNVCPGENVTLTVTASGVPPGETPTYQWTINGQPVPGASSNTLQVPTAGQQPGARQIQVRATAGPLSASSGPVTVGIAASGPPMVQFSIPQSTIALGDRLTLNATAQGTPCTNPVSVRYTASEGTINGNVFDSGSVPMDMTNRLKLQNRPVTITAIATDKNGATARADATVTVTLKPEARRFDDIVFPAGSARVNNCAKRVLLEQLAPIARDNPDGRIILIGHRDQSDRGRLAATVDERRVLDTAAVLSAGTGICASIEPSRITGNWTGTEQASPTRPNFCGTSVTERQGQGVRETDARAQYRRVEVWFVPAGADLPAGLNARDLPEAQIKALGCPR
ncbi:MAG TPA: putative Ig domain-containing protein [Bryobacteraceae bacterium]|nr:putative Ig domain-containing protein [Bryobacteraceae bacterium]